MKSIDSSAEPAAAPVAPKAAIAICVALPEPMTGAVMFSSIRSSRKAKTDPVAALTLTSNSGDFTPLGSVQITW